MSVAGRARKAQSSSSWRPVINGTIANVVPEKHTIQYNIQKHTSEEKARGKVCKKKTKVLYSSTVLYSNQTEV